MEKTSEAAFVLALDMQGFSSLAPTEHDKVIQFVYPAIADIVQADGEHKLLDRKSIGDGFMFYFAAADDAVDAALQIRTLFREKFIWDRHRFNSPLRARIGLHFGQFFRMKDAVEDRDALFGRNIITVARLEPVVRANEIWCTASFKAEGDINKIDERVRFTQLGHCELAKGWSRELVYGIHLFNEEPPAPIPAKPELTTIHHRPVSTEHPFVYFALVKLKHRSDGVEHLKRILSLQAGFKIEAVYDLFGAFDILVRFASERPQTADELSDLLINGRIIWRDDKCLLTPIEFESKLDEPIVVLPPESQEFMKAFIYITARVIVDHQHHLNGVIAAARSACGSGNGIVTYYMDSDTLILPVVIPACDYYHLAKAVEDIEALVDRHHWEHVSIVTYAVQGYEEFFHAR